MKTLMKFLLCSLAIATVSSHANAAEIFARGSGWCNSGNQCNNQNTGAISNHFAGDNGRAYRNWFAFDLPDLTFTSATLRIWNDRQNYNGDPNARYFVFDANSISYSGLISGSPITSIGLSGANAGGSRYIDLNLNGVGLDALSDAAGTRFVFGGFVQSGGGTTDRFAGYTRGTPVARLRFEGFEGGLAAVPEPAPGAMFLLGFFGLGFALRRRKAQERASVHYA